MIEYKIWREEDRMGTRYEFFVPDMLQGLLKLDEFDRRVLTTKEEDVADIFHGLQLIAFRARQQGLLDQR